MWLHILKHSQQINAPNNVAEWKEDHPSICIRRIFHLYMHNKAQL